MLAYPIERYDAAEVARLIADAGPHVCVCGVREPEHALLGCERYDEAAADAALDNDYLWLTDAEYAALG